MSEKREYILKFRVNKSEHNFINSRFEMSGYKSKSKYLRHQIILGKVIKIDESKIDFLRKQIVGACANINQIAHNTNRTKSVLPSDFEEIKEANNTLCEILKELNNFQNEVRNQTWQ